MNFSNTPELRRLQKNAVFGILYRSGGGPADVELAQRIAEALEMQFNNLAKIRNILPLDEADRYMAKQMGMSEDGYRLWLMDVLLEPVQLNKEFALGFQVTQEMVDDDSMYRTEPRRLAVTDNGEDNHASLKRSTSAPRGAAFPVAGAAAAETTRRSMLGAGQPLQDAVVPALGRAASPKPDEDQYSENYRNITEQFDKVEAARMNLDTLLNQSYGSDPHHPAHLSLMAELRRAAVDYINQSRVMLERCNFNSPRPQMGIAAQGVASNGLG